jgi:hypothetical protein
LNSQQDKLKDLHKVLQSLAPTIKHGWSNVLDIRRKMVV